MIYRMKKLYTMGFKIDVSNDEYCDLYDAEIMQSLYDRAVALFNELRPKMRLALQLDLSDIYAPGFVLYSSASLSSRLLHQIETEIKDFIFHIDGQDVMSDEEFESLFDDTEIIDLPPEI